MNFDLVCFKVPSDDTSSVESALVVTRNTPGFIYYWEQRKTMFMPDFQNYIDQLEITGEIVSGDIYK